MDPTVGHIIACWPVLDPSARYEMVLNRGMQRLIDAHHAFWPSIKMMSEGNPQKIIEKGAQQKLPNLLLLQGPRMITSPQIWLIIFLKLILGQVVI